MSRVAKNPISIPDSVKVALSGSKVEIKGSKTTLNYDLHDAVVMTVEGNVATFGIKVGVSGAWAQAGTARSIVNNMVIGVSQGYERRLLLNGVGYRAQAKGKVLNLTLGFSHPVAHPIPEGVTVETPSQTEIVLKGADKQVVGQVASDIRAYRPPEPYKGKGVRYAEEQVRRKEAKKK